MALLSPTKTLAHAKGAAAQHASASFKLASPSRPVARSLQAISGPSTSARRSLACFARGGGVMDAPTTTTTPEKGTEKSYKRPPIYKVLLHNDNYNKREYVVRVLLKVIPVMTADDAVVVMQEAHETGVALVLACPQDEAESYCEGLRLNGLTSTMEPGC